MIVKAKVFTDKFKSILGSIELFPQFIKTKNKTDYKWVY